MTCPATYNFNICQGSTFTLPLRYLDNQNNPVNITGYTFRLQARRNITDSATLIDINTGNSGIVITNATDGRFELRLTATATAALPAGTAVYDLEFVDTTNSVGKLISGTITIQAEVTR